MRATTRLPKAHFILICMTSSGYGAALRLSAG
jgi:hypothetical protein